MVPKIVIHAECSVSMIPTTTGQKPFSYIFMKLSCNVGGHLGLGQTKEVKILMLPKLW